jgi:hypothetical protein
MVSGWIALHYFIFPEKKKNNTPIQPNFGSVRVPELFFFRKSTDYYNVIGHGTLTI